MNNYQCFIGLNKISVHQIINKKHYYYYYYYCNYNYEYLNAFQRIKFKISFLINNLMVAFFGI